MKSGERANANNRLQAVRGSGGYRPEPFAFGAKHPFVYEVWLCVVCGLQIRRGAGAVAGAQIGGIAEPIITVGEYVFWRQWDIFPILRRWARWPEPPGVEVRVRTLRISGEELDRIMREPPKPGRGGLLPEEVKI